MLQRRKEHKRSARGMEGPEEDLAIIKEEARTPVYEQYKEEERIEK